MNVLLPAVCQGLRPIERPVWGRVSRHSDKLWASAESLARPKCCAMHAHLESASRFGPSLYVSTGTRTDRCPKVSARTLRSVDLLRLPCRPGAFCAPVFSHMKYLGHGAGGTRNCVEGRTKIALGWILGRAAVIGTSHYSFRWRDRSIGRDEEMIPSMICMRVGANKGHSDFRLLQQGPKTADQSPPMRIPSNERNSNHQMPPNAGRR